MSEEKAGCEEYLYRPQNCCLHPCPVQECPEPICAADFPGGLKAYLRFKELRKALESGADINSAAVTMGVTTGTAQRRYNRVRSFL